MYSSSKIQVYHLVSEAVFLVPVTDDKALKPKEISHHQARHAYVIDSDLVCTSLRDTISHRPIECDPPRSTQGLSRSSFRMDNPPFKTSLLFWRRFRLTCPAFVDMSPTQRLLAPELALHNFTQISKV